MELIGCTVSIVYRTNIALLVFVLPGMESVAIALGVVVSIWQGFVLLRGG